MKDDLITALAEFSSIQQEHTDLLHTARLKTLPRWFEQRQQAFNRLKESMEQFDPQAVSADSKEAGLILKGLEAVCAGEKMLANQAEYRQNNIHNKLQDMRKGKAVLNKYRGSRAAVTKPRYLSNRM